MENNSTHKHWYEENPSRFEMKKMTMSALFPEFEFEMVNEIEIRYRGTLKSEKFKHQEGYSVVVEYVDGGIENFGNPGIVITPTSPDFNDLFPTSLAYSKELQQQLLNQVAIDMKCVGYEDPATAQTTTINTASSLLTKAIVWFENYESKKKKMEEDIVMNQDAAARKRQELRKRISRVKPYWWEISSEFDLNYNALKGTFPHFEMGIRYINSLDRKRPYLEVRGNVSPGHTIFRNETRGEYLWTYSICLKYYTNYCCYCGVFLSDVDVSLIYDRLGYFPEPLEMDGILWLHEFGTPTIIIHKVMSWIIDLEKLIINDITQAQFNEKWSHLQKISIPKGKLY